MLRPWDRSSVLAACDGEAVRLPVCGGYETRNGHKFCRAGSLARLKASLVLAYLLLGCYVGGILSWFPVAPSGTQMTRRGDQTFDQLSSNINRLSRLSVRFRPCSGGAKSMKIPTREILTLLRRGKIHLNPHQ